MHKPIHEITNVTVNQVKRSLVVFEDGTCESLESALESRIEGKQKRDVVESSFTISNVQLGNGIFSYVKEVRQEKHFCYSTFEESSLKSRDVQQSFALQRIGQDARLMGCTVARGRFEGSNPSLITIWSDKRLFKQSLNPSESHAASVGTLHSIVDSVDANSPLAVTPISEDCIAIYARKSTDDGSFVILYNIKYKVIQSKVPFKVYLSNFKLWSIEKNIFLAMGEQLSVIPYRISIDQLSNMVGSQCDTADHVMIEKEMIDEDEAETIDFDTDQTSVEGMEFKVENQFDGFKRNQTPMLKAIGADEVNDHLEELYREELVVDLVRLDDQAGDTVSVKLLSNVDESFPILSENFETFCTEMEKFGCSEIEITNRIIPVLIKTNRIEDIGLLLKRYNHVSERMLIVIIKYLLSCPLEESKSTTISEANEDETEFDRNQLSKAKRFASNNVFLSSLRSDKRDVLSIVLCCSFDNATIIKFLREKITLDEVIQLMDHLYTILATSSLDDPYELKGNLVDGNNFDYDSKHFEWFTLLLDSHYQQILLSHDSNLCDKLDLWLKLVDNHIVILSQMNNIRSILTKLSTKKPIHMSKKCNQWYSLEKLQIY